jgi:hypothetical protein
MSRQSPGISQDRLFRLYANDLPWRSSCQWLQSPDTADEAVYPQKSARMISRGIILCDYQARKTANSGPDQRLSYPILYLWPAFYTAAGLKKGCIRHNLSIRQTSLSMRSFVKDRQWSRVDQEPDNAGKTAQRLALRRYRIH